MKGRYQKYRDTYIRNRKNKRQCTMFLNLEDSNDLAILAWMKAIKSEVGGGRGNRCGISNYLRELVLNDIEKSLTK